jgi:hypothetical protein
MAHGIGVSPPLSASPTEGEPVAWRVKDYADGWILCHRKDEAVGALGGTAAIIEPLYRHPPASPVAGTDDPGSLDNPALMAYGDDPRIDRHMDAYQYGGDKPVAGEGEDNAAYNAGVIHALEQELISTYARERFGKLPMWARLLVNDLIKRIANLRAKLAKPVAGEGMERDFRQRGEARPEVKK